jgi:polysaccharide export outer membrane protein
MAALVSSCGSYKESAYFYDIQNYKEDLPSADYYDSEPVIKPNDQLLIAVSAPSLYQEKVAQFNLPVSTYLSPGETKVTPTSTFPTYYVDREGNINFPVLGKLKLSGMTKWEASAYMEKLISGHINEDAIVNLQIVSFNISVHGEVFKPGTIEVKNDRISVLDALGAAGGLTIYGNRKNVLLIRDNNGSIEYHLFDLTKSDIFSSPYFYLRQNDVLFVDATKTRMEESEYGVADNYRMNRISTLASVVSSIATLLTLLFINNNK